VKPRLRGVVGSLAAGLIVALIVSATEMVASYPRPSEAALAFFVAAFLGYLPLAILLAGSFAFLAPVRGLNLWLPFLLGILRFAVPAAAHVSANEWGHLLAVAAAVVGVWALARALGPAEGQPPFLFGLTVGVVLPILVARLAVSQSNRFRSVNVAIEAGALVGLLAFVALRAFVSRWPKIMPVFLLGPVVSLGLWSRLPASNSAVAKAVQTDGDTRPDIVLIVLDTVRARALKGYGGAHDTMPGVEEFARKATRFERAWTNASWTLPAHASLFSGLRVGRHRYDSGFDKLDRATSDRFLAERLRRAGYATGAVAANFGVFGREDPLLNGFESVDAEPLRPYVFKPWFFDLIYRLPRMPWLASLGAPFPGPSMRAPWVVARALDFWSRFVSRPRFLFVNLMEAHLPWVPDPEDLARFGPAGLDTEREQIDVLGRYLKQGRPTPSEQAMLRARYEEAIRTLDRSVSRLLAGVSLAEPGRETIVVVTSDHGESLGEHDRFGHRNSLDEEATRIPLVIRASGLVPGTNESSIELVDVYGYLAAQAGMPPEPDLDSVPIGSRERVVMEHRPGPQDALPSSYPRGDISALIEWPYKYVEGPHVEAALFDLASDPTEQRSLMARESARAAAMQRTLREESKVPSRPFVSPDRATEERLRALGYVR
jgi:arylsulfatase A-like enzyme